MTIISLLGLLYSFYFAIEYVEWFFVLTCIGYSLVIYSTGILAKLEQNNELYQKKMRISKDLAKYLLIAFLDGIVETLTYMDFPEEHWKKIRTNNMIERLNREIRRRTCVVGTFPDGESALMMVCARLRHVVSTRWGSKKYMDMKHLYGFDMDNLLD